MDRKEVVMMDSRVYSRQVIVSTLVVPRGLLVFDHTLRKVKLSGTIVDIHSPVRFSRSFHLPMTEPSLEEPHEFVRLVIPTYCFVVDINLNIFESFRCIWPRTSRVFVFCKVSFVFVLRR